MMYSPASGRTLSQTRAMFANLAQRGKLGSATIGTAQKLRLAQHVARVNRQFGQPSVAAARIPVLRQQLARQKSALIGRRIVRTLFSAKARSYQPGAGNMGYGLGKAVRIY